MVKCGKVNKINVNNSADYSSSSFINYSKIPQTKNIAAPQEYDLSH